MDLSEAVENIPNNRILDEFDTLIDKSTVRISYFGQRLIEVAGYEGSITINEFAQKFLQAEALNPSITPKTLARRLHAYNMWNRIQFLYERSDLELKASAYLFQFLTLSLEFRPYCRTCAGDPQAVIGNWDGAAKDLMFTFRPVEFQEYFPKVKPQGKCWVVDRNHSSQSPLEMWYADNKMVRNAIEQGLDNPGVV